MKRFRWLGHLGVVAIFFPRNCHSHPEIKAITHSFMPRVAHAREGILKRTFPYGNARDFWVIRVSGLVRHVSPCMQLWRIRTGFSASMPSKTGGYRGRTPGESAGDVTIGILREHSWEAMIYSTGESGRWKIWNSPWEKLPMTQGKFFPSAFEFAPSSLRFDSRWRQSVFYSVYIVLLFFLLLQKEKKNNF